MVRLSGLARACPRVCSVRVSGAVFSEAVLECVRKCRICPSFAGLVVGCDSDPIATCQRKSLKFNLCSLFYYKSQGYSTKGVTEADVHRNSVSLLGPQLNLTQLSYAVV